MTILQQSLGDEITLDADALTAAGAHQKVRIRRHSMCVATPAPKERDSIPR